MTAVYPDSRGFTLLEMLGVVAIIVIIMAVVFLLINPLEIMRRSRDSTRLSDLEGLVKAVQVGLQDNQDSAVTFLCNGILPPCTGHSNDAGNMRANNGTGWVKINFAGLPTVAVTTLPLDPSNGGSYFYTYSSDGEKYEFNCQLESDSYKDKMQKDGGNNNSAYELGSDLTVLS